MTKRIFLSIAVLLCCGGFAMAQKALTPPHIMIVPDLIYCKANGFTKQFNNNGTTETIPDYERAISEDGTLHAALTQIAQLITDRNSEFVIVDLHQAIDNMKNDAAMSQANFGDDSESVEEAIIRNSNSDILVKVNFDMIKHGPQSQVQYTLKGVDAYTNQTFAPIEGLGQPSTSANPVVLLREAVYNNMNPFLSKMLAYYNNMVKGGRMVAFNIKITGNSSVRMNSKVGQYTLREQIDDFMYDNSVEGKGTERVKAGATFIQYEGVYIPLIQTIRNRQRKQGAKDVADRLVQFLESNSIHAESKIIGLGKVNIYIK